METARLIIDRIRESDRYDYFTSISHDRKVLETFMARYAETLDEVNITPYVNYPTMFAIRLKETGKLIGTILSFEEKDDHCEIGYALSSRYWNQGYMSEAVNCFLDYLFAEKGVNRVYASYFTGNEASRRVMEKVGMTYDRFVERELEYRGQPRDVVYYVIDRDRWKTLRNKFD